MNAWGNWTKAKYKATWVKHAGRSFASKLEAAVFDILTLRVRAGDIRDLRCQHTVDLIGGIRWRVDFSAVDCATGELFFAEAKGFPTQEYKMKLKLWPECRTEKLEIWGGSYKKPKLMQTIIPKKTEALVDA